MHDISDLVFKSLGFFIMYPANICLFKFNNQNKALNISTANNKDTIIRYRNRSSAYFLNLKRLSQLILALQVLTLNR